MNKVKRLLGLLLSLTICYQINSQHPTVKRIIPHNLNNVVYEISNFGKRTWTVENVKATILIGNLALPVAKSTVLSDSICKGAVYISNNGYLYNWFVVESEKICPYGWRVPSLREFYQLVEFIDNDSSKIARLNLKNYAQINLWTSNPVNDKFAISVNLISNHKKLTLEIDSMTPKSKWINIRCIQE